MQVSSNAKLLPSLRLAWSLNNFFYRLLEGQACLDPGKHCWTCLQTCTYDAWKSSKSRNSQSPVHSQEAVPRFAVHVNIVFRQRREGSDGVAHAALGKGDVEDFGCRWRQRRSTILLFVATATLGISIVDLSVFVLHNRGSSLSRLASLDTSPCPTWRD